MGAAAQRGLEGRFRSHKKLSRALQQLDQAKRSSIFSFWCPNGREPTSRTRVQEHPSPFQCPEYRLVDILPGPQARVWQGLFSWPAASRVQQEDKRFPRTLSSSAFKAGNPLRGNCYRKRLIYWFCWLLPATASAQKRSTSEQRSLSRWHRQHPGASLGLCQQPAQRVSAFLPRVSVPRGLVL